MWRSNKSKDRFDSRMINECTASYILLWWVSWMLIRKEKWEQNKVHRVIIFPLHCIFSFCWLLPRLSTWWGVLGFWRGVRLRPCSIRRSCRRRRPCRGRRGILRRCRAWEAGWGGWCGTRRRVDAALQLTIRKWGGCCWWLVYGPT